MKATVISNKKLGREYFRTIFHSPRLARTSKPGQFGMLQVREEGCDPFLRRPMSFCRMDRENGAVEIMYRLVGKGTKYLSRLRSGEEIDILGPLGNGFSIKKNKYALIVGGGIGISPLVGLAESICEKKAFKGHVKVLIGGRARDDILAVKDFKKIGAKLGITTEDGSLGYKGFVTDIIHEYMPSVNDASAAVIYACGPNGMLKQINSLAESLSMECQISVEAHMACGTGACLGCVIKVKGIEEYKTVCKQGPVFDSRRVVW